MHHELINELSGIGISQHKSIRHLRLSVNNNYPIEFGSQTHSSRIQIAFELF